MIEEMNIAPLSVRQAKSIKELRASAKDLSKSTKTLRKIIGDIKMDMIAGGTLISAAQSASGSDSLRAA